MNPTLVDAHWHLHPNRKSLRAVSHLRRAHPKQAQGRPCSPAGWLFSLGVGSGQGGEVTISESVLHVALGDVVMGGLWWCWGLGDGEISSSLDDFGVHKGMPCTATALFKGLEGRMQVPCALKIPVGHSLVLLPLLMGVHLSLHHDFP